MEGPPYRAMPLPPAPPRAWRPIIERCLAVFNGAVLAAYVRYGVPLLNGRCHVPLTLGRSILAWFPLLALIGFLSRGRWWLRLCLTLPSGVLWFFLGLVLTIIAVVNLLCPDAISLAMPLAMAPLFLVAGVLTIDAAFAWLRHS